MQNFPCLAGLAGLLLCAGCAIEQQHPATHTQGILRSVDSHNQARLTARATFDAHGRVASATIIESSGSAILDRETLTYAKKNWSGPPNATKDVPCYYKLHPKA